MAEIANKYIAKDFKSPQEVRWCPGCGDHGILNAVQRAFAELPHKKEDYAIISGIGCSSRFPYYMNTYGFHTIHGRAGAIATGVKTANPELSVWQVTGDGDGLAIGGNHFIHEIRRNVDLNVLLFNNEIYGLTKGQYSPTSKIGTKTKTSPFGCVDRPFKVGQLVIGSDGSFFARALDSNIKHAVETLIQADKHQGTSVVEILQNCVIFSDKVHGWITDKEHKEDRQLFLVQGEKMIFGKEKNKGIAMDHGRLKVITIGVDGYTIDDVLTHDAHITEPFIHLMLSNMEGPNFPVAFGVIRAVKEPVYDIEVEKQVNEILAETKFKGMDDVLASGSTWEVR